MALDTGNNLVTLLAVKSYLGIDTTAVDHDDRLERIIDGVSWEFNEYTGRKLKARDITEYQDGNGKANILTNQFPINSNSTSITIHVDVNRNYTTDKLVDSTSIVIYSTEGKIFLDDDTFEAGEQAKIGRASCRERV